MHHITFVIFLKFLSAVLFRGNFDPLTADIKTNKAKQIKRKTNERQSLNLILSDESHKKLWSCHPPWHHVTRG